MNIAQLKSTREAAHDQRISHTLVPGLGYVRLGEPLMPANPVFPVAACLPPEGTPDLTIMAFILPGTTEPSIRLQWMAEKLVWAPLSPIAGNRLAYRPGYLAAHGWKLA